MASQSFAMTKKKSPPIDLDAGRIQSTSVGLKTGEVEALDQIGREHGLSRNALMRLVIREWLVKYRRGEIDLEQYKKKTIIETWQLPK